MSSSLPSIGQFTNDLVHEGLITKEQLAVAKVSVNNLGEDLGSILVKRGFINEKQLLQFLSRHIKIPYISLKNIKPDKDLLREISATSAKRHLILPLRETDGKIEVAMANPVDSFAIDDLKMAFHQEIIPYLANADEIRKALEEAYATVSPEEDGVSRIALIENITEGGDTGEMEFKKIQEIASGPKVIAAVNDLILRAWSDAASDIHIEPFKDSSRVRYRVDGLLHERAVLPKNMHIAVVSRIKIMAGLDIAEHRIPQDGRVRIRLVGRTLDLRISTCPTQYGEKIVLRLLSKESLRSIDDLGFSKKDRQIFTEMVTRSHGIFLATGPTGSGKSTTLYAALARINSPELNIISIEDPIESEIGNISQVAINPKAGLTFASILRSVLRQDPDVIMIGEIRDAETASIAVRAAITGHLVLSTLHTNTASGAMSRLMDLGVEPFLLSSALQGVLAQRLVRKICAECREEVPLDSEKMGPYAKLVKKAFRGKGCNACHLTGYSGRVGIFEMAPITETLRQLIYNRAPDLEIEKELRRLGHGEIRQDGFSKVEQGITTLEEVLRVTEED
ncbi:MAG: ATPase, T2SS/T4P/T4SS family [Deltaproteobacteria bacterium]|nr:ATPase, T2SS/T4P/T4SS family [Deltaproteobacteria bacterium]